MSLGAGNLHRWWLTHRRASVTGLAVLVAAVLAGGIYGLTRGDGGAPRRLAAAAPPTTGAPAPTVPPSSVASPAPPALTCSLQVSAQADLAGVIEAQPGGTTFCLGGGTFHLTRPAVPKEGDAFVGSVADRPVIDASTTTYGFDVHQAANVIFENLVVSGATSPGRAACATCGRGIWGGDRMQVFNVEASHNTQDGIGGGDNVTQGWLIVDSQLVANGSADQGFAAAGVKSAKSYTLLNSYVADNMGAGAWCDVGCRGDTWTVEGNVVKDNASGGIRYEISSAGALIKDNQISGNNTADNPGGAGIEVVSSANAMVQANTIHTTNGCAAIRVTEGANRARAAFGA
ncbi:MAG: right-handed parallel beta-helix repeat-containing protein, partial [Acidimicrobiales bacterium]